MGVPLSIDPRKRRRQLANLRAAPPAPPAGNDRAATHRGYARVAPGRRDAKAATVFQALAGDAPLRDSNGSLPRADEWTVRLLAECLCRLEDVSADLDAHGWRDRETGEPRPAMSRETELRREAFGYVEALGMSPRSRARLGLNLARTVDLATALSEPDAARRAELLREAGLGDER
jgi:hypothetical protein